VTFVRRACVWALQISIRVCHSYNSSLSSRGNMKYFTPDQKHHILIHLQARRKGVNPDDIVHQHGVAGGRRTLNRWLAQWNGTPQSLERKAGSGRPRRLSRAQVTQHLKPRILAANRRAEPIHYPTLLPAITAATGKALLLQTLRQYGKKQRSNYKSSKREALREQEMSVSQP